MSRVDLREKYFSSVGKLRRGVRISRGLGLAWRPSKGLLRAAPFPEHTRALLVGAALQTKPLLSPPRALGDGVRGGPGCPLSLGMGTG